MTRKREMAISRQQIAVVAARHRVHEIVKEAAFDREAYTKDWWRRLQDAHNALAGEEAVLDHILNGGRIA